MKSGNWVAILAIIVSSLPFLQSPATADPSVYVVTTSNVIGTEDLSTGVLTVGGPINGDLATAGLGEVGGNLYLASANYGSLVKVNLSNWTYSLIGYDSYGFTTFGSTLTSLYADIR